MSLARTLRNIRRVGLRQWIRDMQYIGDAKSGTLVGTDEFGNKYYENLNAKEEVPGRHRWMEFAQHNYHASQVPPEWHSWISHIRKDPPTEDKIMQMMTPPWKSKHHENLTGTRGAYKPYNTAAPKFYAWEPKISQRGGSSSNA